MVKKTHVHGEKTFCLYMKKRSKDLKKLKYLCKKYHKHKKILAKKTIEDTLIFLVTSPLKSKKKILLDQVHAEFVVRRFDKLVDKEV